MEEQRDYCLREIYIPFAFGYISQCEQENRYRYSGTNLDEVMKHEEVADIHQHGNQNIRGVPEDCIQMESADKMAYIPRRNRKLGDT